MLAHGAWEMKILPEFFFVCVIAVPQQTALWFALESDVWNQQILHFI